MGVCIGGLICSKPFSLPILTQNTLGLCITAFALQDLLLERTFNKLGQHQQLFRPQG